jgi:hypothetical protein
LALKLATGVSGPMAGSKDTKRTTAGIRAKMGQRWS